MATEDLKPRQYKRVGRISENNPERAERVAERLVTKSERASKGKKIADKYSSSNKMPQAQYEQVRKDIRPKEYAAQSYDSTNFKNKDVDKFKNRFENGKSQPWEIHTIKKQKP
jgi:hypothetical protein